MSPATALLAELRAAGIELRADGDRLRFKPRAAMTPDLAARVKGCKRELLALLAGNVCEWNGQTFPMRPSPPPNMPAPPPGKVGETVEQWWNPRRGWHWRARPTSDMDRAHWVMLKAEGLAAKLFPASELEATTKAAKAELERSIERLVAVAANVPAGRCIDFDEACPACGRLLHETAPDSAGCSHKHTRVGPSGKAPYNTPEVCGAWNGGDC